MVEELVVENCNGGGKCDVCLLYQQLYAQSILSFGNLVTTSHNQDIEYLKSTQVITMNAIGMSSPTT